MRNGSVLLVRASVAAACLLAVWLCPSSAYIKVEPLTLGNLCSQSDHVYVLRVKEVNAEKGVILFKPVEQLKGKPDGTAAKHVIGPKVKGAKVILDWAAEGKTAVIFCNVEKGYGRGHAYIDGYWYWMTYNDEDKVWTAGAGEPAWLTQYCGTADKLRDALVKVLAGKEVVVPCMVNDSKEDLEQRRARVHYLRASLKIKEYDPKRLFVGDKKPDDKKTDDRKPAVKKPDLKKPALVGTVKALAEGKSFTLQPAPTKKDEKPPTVEVRIGEGTKITTGKAPAKLTVGQFVSVWLAEGKNAALTVQVGKPSDNKPVKKPDVNDKPARVRKPRTASKPARDPAPIARVIDAEVDRYLTREKIPASPQADDAEFLRRVTLDLTGRIPTYQQTVAFLDSKASDKRRKLIDELLDGPEYAEHFATVWSNLIVGRNNLAFGKQRGDGFGPWLADQFDDNRGWDAIVKDLLTAEGNPRETPAATFLMANGENGQPQPNKIASATARLFWGVNLGCAECHNHPFAKWKQSDFWGTAAFFGKVRLDGPKSGPVTLTEVAGTSSGNNKKNGGMAFAVRGSAIVVPNGAGKSSGQAIKARFLGGDEATLIEDKPFRPRFADWATSKDNPYFAQAAVNRTWAHFFGRGFVNPPDGFDENNLPSHPALLKRLSDEFASSGFDLKHLARVITTSKAYQRTSRPAKGNEGDDTGFSHVAVKVLTPEAFFDSVGVVMRGSTDKQESREQFVRTFRPEGSATEYTQGIPQQLRLMNAPLLNRSAPVVDRLSSSGGSRTEAITTLYLTALSRRPTADEVKLMEGYLSRRKSDREGYRGVLWILMNSSEFALNR